MSYISRMLIGTVIIAIIATPALSETTEQISEVVKTCVEEANANHHTDYPVKAHLGAYYDPATRRIRHNFENSVGSQITDLIFAFEKCMAESGFSVKLR